ncbi:hypothetical protein CI109_104187 [Kwoniella shandongensis]|uniref:Uncharacterized protein n=1 Tax=Kwoniella shandongensis TaxID=1734106 RepID=A0A5M6C167_9TREE|nr:uncharacterized protein CI109_002901 [Kwoniella shandongensis]KAA5528743.1 hypothetical protein CI109_002901 [Kwoniella shandongensis]
MAEPLNDAIVLFGDSLTSRQEVPWNLHHRLSQSYRGKLDVINRGYGGYNTVWLRELFDKIFTKKEKVEGTRPVVRLVTIWLGTNDAALPGHAQHVPLSTFKTNMNHFLHSLTSPSSPYAASHNPKAKNIILITPTIFNPLQWEADLPDKDKSRKLETTRKYKDAVLELGEEWRAKSEKEGWGLGVVDLWGAMAAANGGKEEGKELEKFFNDGLHLTTDGYDVLWQQASKIIKQDFAGRGLDWEDVKDLPFRAPTWEEINYDHPETIKDKLKLPACRQ